MTPTKETVRALLDRLPEDCSLDDVQYHLCVIQPLSRRTLVNPYIKDVYPLEDYQLEVEFENGERRIFDAKPYLQRGVFFGLQNRAIFHAARAVAGSLEWPGDLDLSYDTVYLESRPAAAAPAIANGRRGSGGHRPS